MKRDSARVIVPAEERLRMQGFRSTAMLDGDVPEFSLLAGDYIIYDHRGMPAGIFRPLDAPTDIRLAMRLGRGGGR
jgi:hypothetical protein